MAVAVELLPQPAITGTRPRATSTVSSITRRCSAALSVTLSPVVPHGTRALLPSAICHSTSSRNVSSATRPPENGVTRAGIDPKNMNLSPYGGFRFTSGLLRSGTDKDRSNTMSSMRPAAFLLPLLAVAATGSAQSSLQPAYRPAYQAPTARVSNDIAWAIADWRRLRQSSNYGFADYARFLNANPGWPGETTMRRNAETAMRAGENPATVLAFFATHQPTTGGGYARLADALLANGRQAEAIAAAKEAWASHDLSATDEPLVYARYGAQFTRADHDRRTDALLFAKKASDAYRFLTMVSPHRAASFSARVAMQSKSPDAERRYQPLMATVTSDAGLMMDRARFLRDSGFE